MKKIVSLVSAAAIFAAASGAVIAEGNNPAVYVNDREIFFNDQPAVIVEERTLVPARGVFEAMGATVDWDGDKRQVQVTSPDTQTIIRLTIDDADMKVYDMSGLFATLMSGQDFKAPETIVTLDVPAQIMNDRTMVPLRAISEAFDSNVEWNGEEYCVEITTKDAKEAAEDALTLSLTSAAKNVKEGEEFDLYINITNLPENVFVGGVTASLYYDSDNFEFEKATLVNEDTEFDGSGVVNASFTDKLLKASYITIDADSAVKTDGKIMKLTFKSLTGKEGAFVISNGYQTALGYNTAITLAPSDNTTVSDLVRYEGNNLYIDTTPVVINGDDAAEVTATPEATAEPETSAAPEATAEPETTAEPTASVEPETSAEPEASAEPTASPAA